jgi:uncharacterized membrane protein
MDTLSFAMDWANLLLRWAHVVTVIAWIGSSFYFVFLDTSLTPPADAALRAKGVDGELWAVHGGGFYNPQKYLVAPASLPEKLHWFYWESYSTWLTGFALFTVLYLFQAGTFLIDPAVFAWTRSGAVFAALGFLAGFWLLYDQICRRLGERAATARFVGPLVAASVVVASWAACQLFAGRAAFLIVGAMMATAMSANVARWIIPGQRRVIAQMKAGEPVEAIHGRRAKQRSVHNTYFTLPVVVAMLSNHYGWLSQGSGNWLTLVGLMAAGAAARQFFVARHASHRDGLPTRWGMALLSVGLVLATIAGQGALRQQAALAEARQEAAGAAAAVPSIADVRRIVDQRCVLCHNAQVQNKGIALHTDSLLRQHAQAAYQQVVVQKAMPMNNATGITPAERALIGRWVEAGAP